MLHCCVVGQHTIEANVANHTEVRYETLWYGIERLLAALRDVEVRHVNEENRLLSLHNAVHVLVFQNIVTQVLCNASLIVAYLPK